MRKQSITTPHIKNATAIKGTNFSVIEASLLTPPKNTKVQSATNTSPTIQVNSEGIPNALENDSAIALDCTISPINPSASIVAIAKTRARIFPNVPRKAYFI